MAGDVELDTSERENAAVLQTAPVARARRLRSVTWEVTLGLRHWKDLTNTASFRITQVQSSSPRTDHDQRDDPDHEERWYLVDNPIKFI